MRFMSSGRFKNYYKVLEIELFASVDDIKSAFRRLARIHHPDVNQGNSEKFKEINEAYEVLGNSQKKAVSIQRRRKNSFNKPDQPILSAINRYNYTKALVWLS